MDPVTFVSYPGFCRGDNIWYDGLKGIIVSVMITENITCDVALVENEKYVVEIESTNEMFLVDKTFITKRK